MKAVQLLANSYFPEELRDYKGDFTKKDIERRLQAVGHSKDHKGKFAEIEKQLSDLGRKASYYQGETITLDDLRPVVDKKAMFAAMNAEIKALPKNKDYAKNKAEIQQKYNTWIEKEVSKNALANRNSIALAVLSGARGKSAQLKAMLGSPMQFSDSKGRTIDVISKESYAEGVRPAVYLASTHGSRSSVVSTKCLDGETLVRMADLSERKIKDIKAGEFVLGADRKGNKFSVEVLNVFDQGDKDCYTWRFPHVGEVTCTEDHKFLDLGSYTIADAPTLEEIMNYKFTTGDVLPMRRFGGHVPRKHVGLVHCYDIEVDHQDHLFVLANGLITSNSSTAKGGDLAKQFAQVAGDIIVKKNNCGTPNGISLEIDDKSLKGRALAKDAGPFKAGTFLTKDDITTLRKHGVKNVVVRSALTCSVDGGVCAHCLGKFYKGGSLPEVGDAVGLTAASVGFEPVTQLALNAKHTSGMTSAKRTYGGLPTIIQFTQSPEKYKDRAAVSEVDGKVEKVEEAPQGGMYVTVEGRKHYVPSGHDVEVKPGDVVEAGDFLSEGLGDAEDIIRLKGLGAGRKYYADRLNRILKDSGTWTDPRNTEILARAAVRHVRITNDEGLGHYLPDDIVDYSALQNSYKMPETTTVADPRRVVGKYLQAPAMHYTIGTRITDKVAKDLYDNGYTGVYADSYQPSFEPEMVRLRASSHNNRDWVASLGTSYITKQLNEAVERGDDTNVEENSDYRPRIAWGTGFGEHVRETGKF